MNESVCSQHACSTEKLKPFPMKGGAGFASFTIASLLFLGGAFPRQAVAASLLPRTRPFPNPVFFGLGGGWLVLYLAWASVALLFCLALALAAKREIPPPN
jgi:hypothetical protein